MARRPTRQKVLRYAFEVAESGFDPAPLTDLYSRVVTAHIFESLYRYDHLARPFKIKPLHGRRVARGVGRLPRLDDQAAARHLLRRRSGIQGRKRELVAEDYVYTWKRIMDPRWKSAELGLDVASRRSSA